MNGLAKKTSLKIVIAVLLAVTGAVTVQAAKGPASASGPVDPGYRTMLNTMDIENRVHDVGKLWLNVTNYGYFGNDGETRAGSLPDPCTNEWAPQAEFPGGSGVQYLFQGGLWIGAMIKEEGFEYPRVSHGLEGWVASANNDFLGQEFFPGYEPDHGIEERSTRQQAFNCLGDFISSDSAVSEQDFIATYTDTSRLDPTGRLISTAKDGAHIPLGIKVTQKSYAWSYNYAQDFLLIDYEIENIANNFLKNLYIGLYVDADVGMVGESERHTDDICGFKKSFEYTPDGGSESINLTINTAYIADNDGRPPNVSSGAFSCPGVTGARVVRAPNPKLRTSFNWWISNQDETLDFGPAWRDDGSPGAWTASLGTPEDDARKYFVLSNREFDYDQVYVDDPDYITQHPQEFRSRFAAPDAPPAESYDWYIPGEDDNTPPEVPADLADGYDTRYLISWGPLGIFDFIDEAGNRVYRLNPGEKFTMTIAYVGGQNFHDRNNPQDTDTNLDPAKYDFSDFQYNADWAAKVYDNPMIDSNGDGWFGEDVGVDSVYSDTIGKTVEFTDVWGVTRSYVYEGPDEGETDGLLQSEEDQNGFRPTFVDYTYNNELFDQGDGIADFQGPPPPETPVLSYEVTEDELTLVWHKFPSEDPNYVDPFSRLQDFEAYRVYVSNEGLENTFSFLAEFDVEDYGYYSERDSLMEVPIKTTNPDTLDPTIIDGVGTVGYLQPVGPNVGLEGIAFDDSTYKFNLGKVNPLIPRYYCVTAVDFGDPFSGTEPLETAKTANMLYMAPSGSPKKKPGVVPNPYRADQDYTAQHMQVLFENDTTFVSWENRDDGTSDFFPQTDRRIYFYNLPRQCLIRIFTVSGDLVQIIDHNVHGNRISTWSSDFAAVWDLNSRNRQQVVSGLYLFSVEDMTPENKGHIDVGKFVIIR